MTAMSEVEVRDRADVPAVIVGCERCTAPALLRPGGLCADCVAAVGLAADQSEYQAWRRRVSEEVEARRSS